ncbi:hypothetical protein [Actinopolyspora xinjiangensis]|uniref:hypothetical protein n=1 Tax=Actinopolyspora xinjiangensis TaxID=405564 RepID=UPI001113F4FD
MDGELHRFLNATATSENRSMNELVTAALSGTVDGPVSHRRVCRRDRASGVFGGSSVTRRGVDSG